MIGNQLAFWVTLCLFVGLLHDTPAFASQQRGLRLSPQARKAYRTIRRAELFINGSFGFAGETPSTVKAVGVLLKEKAAGVIFKRLLAKASVPGQLYALCGLYHADHNYFQTAVIKYQRSKTKVPTLSGSMEMPMRVSEIVESKNPMTVRLKAPSQSFDQWLKTNPKQARLGYILDIVGGGYPSLFKMATQKLE